MIKHILFVDFETHYSQDYSLRCMSVPEYILDNRFQVHLLAVFDINWPAPRVLEADEIEAFLAQYPANETMAIAHNFLFDGAVLAWRYGWVPARMQDTLGMVRSLRSFKRNSLGFVSKELFGHDSKGDIIHKLKGLDVAGIKQQGYWPTYRTYSMEDARICSNIYFKLLPEFPLEEQKIMDLVLRCGIVPTLHADVPMLQVHLDELRKRKQKLLNDCGYEKAALMSTAQFQTALEKLGVIVKYKMSATGSTIPAFAKSDDYMRNLQFYDQGSETVNFKVQTLAAARLAHKSTIEETRAEKFLKVAQVPWPDGQHLMPVPLRFGGAHTHRLSGEGGMNLQNLPRDRNKSKLRTALLAPPGCKLIAADSSQIEARLVAVLSEQKDLIEAFRNGEDVYSSFASIVFRRPVNKRDNPHERFLGKTAILSLGYSAGAERFFQMVTTQAQQNNIPLEGLFDRTMAQATVDTYRQTYRRIPYTWHKLDGLLQTVLLNPKPTKHNFGPVTFEQRRIQLPNGMFLRYEGAAGTDLFGAKCLENCLAADTNVLTPNGWKSIVELQHHELVFDGVEWVQHSGVIKHPVANTIAVDGVRMTPDHRVLTTDGWVRAAFTEGLYRTKVRVPDSTTGCWYNRNKTVVETTLHMRQNSYTTNQRVPQKSVLRLQARRVDYSSKYSTWDVLSPSLLGLAFNVRSLPFAYTSGLEKLWGAWHKSLFALAKIRKFLGRYGVYLPTQSDARAPQQQSRLFQSKLLLGKLLRTGSQSSKQPQNQYSLGDANSFRGGTKGQNRQFDVALSARQQMAFGQIVCTSELPEPVFDILNCGPRQRFVVQGGDGPFIVHNCSQALARIVIMQTALRLYQKYELRFIMQSHDELVFAVPDHEVEWAKSVIMDEMIAPPAWLPNLPLAAEIGVGDNYGSAK